MKTVACLLPILLLLAGCEKEEPTPDDILGTWRLTQVYVDPGDGSGEYQPATYQRTITFFPDTSYHTDLGICTLGNHTAGGTGLYSPTEKYVAPTHCEIKAKYSYQLEGRRLSINYWCIEGCAERYVKVSDL